ncbi:MAG: hypothetical protein M1814_000170 [Vezdaea aestivalis]|nr:MAG: hypothetical protein M1814_000170 [Vezdaea aestivalis]
MRWNTAFAAALCSTAALVGQVRADELEEPIVGEAASSAAETSSATVVDRPTFTPTSLKAPFFEQFTTGWESRWRKSSATKEDSSEEEWAYNGEWAVEEPTIFKGIDGDEGLVVKNAAAHHAISAKFPKKIDNKGKTLVVQYEVKLQNGLECGGAYLKLLKDSKALHREEFSNASPYVIMFGPDRCGQTNKVHFIFKHKNPKTGEYEEKHMNAPPAARIAKISHLYTLIVKPDQTFEILIDGDRVKNGTLHDDFTPPVNPAKEIDDKNDKKPDDWVDQERIQDADAKKPDDWDETEPFEIVDAEAEKPEDWLDDEPSVVPDPEAEKPEDWDDEEDGDWIAPTVPNPKCDEHAGCGKWEAPMKRNPKHRGVWTAPYIENPAYKGPWKPKQIKNPDYFNDKTPSTFEPMGAVGFEIWTMQNDILFDNIYIGHSVEDAKKLQKETFDIKMPIERKDEELTAPPPAEKPKSPLDLKFSDDPVKYIRDKTELFIMLAKNNPIEAIKFVPEVAGGLVALLLTVVSLVVGIIFLSGSSAPPQVQKVVEKTKENATEGKDKVVDAATSGAEAVKTEAVRRSNRRAD